MTIRPLRSSAIVALPVLAACISQHQDEQRPELAALMRGQVRDGWASESVEGEYDREAFWQTFDDPVLDDLVREALLHNNDLIAAAERLRAAAARSWVARSARRPQADARLDYTRQKQVFIGFPIPGDEVPSVTFDQWAAAVDVSWEIDLWGKLAAGVDAADADVESFFADYQAARLSIAAQVAITWFALREANEQVALSEQTLDTFLGSLRVVQDRYDAGLSGALDLKLSEANVAGSRARLAEATQFRNQAARQIEILLGRFPGAELEAAGRFAGLPPDVPAGLPAQILARRPDLVSLERRVTAAEAIAKQDRLDRLPSFFLTASGGTTTEEFEDLIDGDFTVWSFATRLVQPLFDGGRRRARYEESLAAVREVRALYANAALRAFFEVENALDGEQRLRERLGHLEEAALRSQEATALADDQYREGLVSIELVLESQRRQLQAESSFLESRRLLYQNRVDLHVALGGGFDASPALVDAALAALENPEENPAEESVGEGSQETDPDAEEAQPESGGE